MLRHNIFWYAAQLGILNYDRDFWKVCEEAGVEVLEEDLAPYQDYENHDADPQGLSSLSKWPHRPDRCHRSGDRAETLPFLYFQAYTRPQRYGGL